MSSHVTSGPDQPWHHHLTIDLLAHVLQRSLFHPFIACLIPLCQRALGAPYTSPQFLSTCAYAIFISLLSILSAFDQRIAYGAPRQLDWDEEVVVITGGASGLGKILVQMYGMRGASVAVLDVRIPDEKQREREEGLADVRFYECDVGDVGAVERVKGEIETDVRSHHLSYSHATKSRFSNQRFPQKLPC